MNDRQAHHAAILAACPIRRVDRAPRRTCTDCDGDGLATGPPECRRCRRCDGTGLLPALAPDWHGDGIVRLTTWPDETELVVLESAGYWKLVSFPGVRFELPPPPQWQSYTTRYAEMNRENLARQLLEAAGRMVWNPSSSSPAPSGEGPGLPPQSSP